MRSIGKLEAEYNDLERNNTWMEAFQSLRSGSYDSASFQSAKHSFNIRYNRYRDILPYDHSRVKLKGLSDTDYINANYVECKKADRIYILAQAPLNHTREHFWQMIWEQKTLGIVMLNRLFEKGTQKCEMYYPNLDEENAEMTLECGKFRLNYLSERTFKDFSIRTIECENLEQKEKRIVYHCHFTNWPDFGEPEYPTTFLRFLHECELLDIFNRELYGPCVIHCSAGVGRSGTFILVDSMLQLLKKYGDDMPLSVFELLSELRTYRMALVQTPQQLRFAYRAILEAMKRSEQQRHVMNDEEKSGTTANGYVDDDPDSQQITTESDEIDVDDDDHDDEDDDDRDDENDDDASSSDDEDFYEGEDDEATTRRRSGRHDQATSSEGQNVKRPSTARPGGKVAKLKLSSKSQNRIKNLRLMQLRNRDFNEENLIKTAVSKVTSSKNTGKLMDSEEEDEKEKDEKPFDRRDVETVKVNEPRKPLIDKLQQKQQQQTSEQSKQPEQINETKNVSNAPSSGSAQEKRPLSDKNARIADLVRSIKDKQIEQERRKHRLELYRPWLICGGVLIGGIVLQQIFKRFFY